MFETLRPLSFSRFHLPVSLLVLLVAIGCAQEAETPAETSAKTYDARGIVRQLPSASAPGGEIFIHHEAIASFESIDGEVVGMDSMTMGFPVADAAMLEGLVVGDKVDFSLAVDWDGSPPLALTRLEKLPSSTTLAFEVDGGSGDADTAHDPDAHAHHLSDAADAEDDASSEASNSGGGAL